MSTNGEVADLMVREGIQITESAVKLAGLGAKNLAALLIAVAKEDHKLAGKASLKRLIQDGEQLTIFSIQEEDLGNFRKASKGYGVLYCPIINKAEKTGKVEIMAKARDAQQINRIMERLGYPAPTQGGPAPKKAPSRDPSVNDSGSRGRVGPSSTAPAPMGTKPSVRGRLTQYKAQVQAQSQAATVAQAAKAAIHKADPTK